MKAVIFLGGFLRDLALRCLSALRNIAPLVKEPHTLKTALFAAAALKISPPAALWTGPLRLGELCFLTAGNQLAAYSTRVVKKPMQTSKSHRAFSGSLSYSTMPQSFSGWNWTPRQKVLSWRSTASMMSMPL